MQNNINKSKCHKSPSHNSIDGDFLYRYHSDNLGCISIDIKLYLNTLKDI